MFVSDIKKTSIQILYESTNGYDTKKHVEAVF